ncbi:MAG: hypothetical protein JW739_08265 [Opitutales bacterium]|nr:hypothetical protein [Opitutales bacterium]
MMILKKCTEEDIYSEFGKCPPDASNIHEDIFPLLFRGHLHLDPYVIRPRYSVIHASPWLKYVKAYCQPSMTSMSRDKLGFLTVFNSARDQAYIEDYAVERAPYDNEIRDREVSEMLKLPEQDFIFATYQTYLDKQRNMILMRYICYKGCFYQVPRSCFMVRLIFLLFPVIRIYINFRERRIVQRDERKPSKVSRRIAEHLRKRTKTAEQINLCNRYWLRSLRCITSALTSFVKNGHE